MAKHQKLKKVFPIADILTVTTGYTLSPRSGKAILDIIGFMHQDDGVNSSAIEAEGHSGTCGTELKRQHPKLAEATVPNVDRLTPAAKEEFLRHWTVLLGEELEVETL